MRSQVLMDQLTPRCCPHMSPKVFVNMLKFKVLLPQFDFDIVGWEDVLKINPVLLDNQPVVYQHHSVEDSLLQVLGLLTLSF